MPEIVLQKVDVKHASFIRTIQNLPNKKWGLTFTTEAKLSSKIMISELSLATSVPWIPIARPISTYIPKCRELQKKNKI